ncbi:ribokinase [Aerococcus agrisoli]|uniref:Ribokinase n=1 Tax=Aerococcus agrisoli TaxID=2487350 RepID=A0A3N4GVE1_9LACT|nr:ribokinase [Aerococcus agrisoli]RPA56954.1 ribokinase [Aerococcus agrisoli]
MNQITVIGSISTDFVVTTDILPSIGETVSGLDFNQSFGGKGANQAVAAVRLGGQVTMVGAVGDDVFGDQLIANLDNNGISTVNVERVTHVPSGSAIITLHQNDNAIIYVAGANNLISTIGSEEIAAVIKQSEIVILQNEIPQGQIDWILETANRLDVPVLYNPAPARQVKQELMDKVTYFTPNESEFSLIFKGLSLSEGLHRYPNKLLVTLGSKGVIYFDGKEEVLVPAYHVQPVDTTGAGDTFNGAFAVAVTKGLALKDSVRFGNLAASLSIQKFGAQGGMPTIEEMKGSKDYEEAWDFE